MDLYNDDYCTYNYFSVITDVPTEQEIPAVENLDQALKLLGPENLFVDFDLGITSEEKAILDSLKVDCFGSQESGESININKFHSECTAYFKSMGNDEELSSSAASIANKMINSYVRDKDNHQPELYKVKYTYITVFANCGFNEPLTGGWHVDYFSSSEYNYDLENPMYYKVILMLKGPGTLFCKPLETMSNRATYEEANEIGDSCLKRNTIHQAKPTFGSVFLMSDTNMAAVHSAPSTADNNYLKNDGVFYRLGFKFDGRIKVTQETLSTN